jgi:hypothetical protein
MYEVIGYVNITREAEFIWDRQKIDLHNAYPVRIGDVCVEAVPVPYTANHFVAFMQEHWEKPFADITGGASKKDLHVTKLT